MVGRDTGRGGTLNIWCVSGWDMSCPVHILEGSKHGHSELCVFVQKKRSYMHRTTFLLNSLTRSVSSSLQQRSPTLCLCLSFSLPGSSATPPGRVQRAVGCRVLVLWGVLPPHVSPLRLVPRCGAAVMSARLGHLKVSSLGRVQGKFTVYIRRFNLSPSAARPVGRDLRSGTENRLDTGEENRSI